MLKSLWYLFRGKKENVLRKRIDSLNYNIDQLLLGTLMFSILTLLVPTVGVYVLFYILLKLTLCGIGLICNIFVLIFKYSPLHIILLYLAKPPLSLGKSNLIYKL